MSEKKDKEEKLEETLKVKILEQRIEEIQQEFQELEKKENEFTKISKSLEEIKKDKEILCNIGPGIFVKTKILDENLFMNVGSQTVVKKKTEEVKKIIEKQILKIRSLKHKKEEEFNEILVSLQRLLAKE